MNDRQEERSIKAAVFNSPFLDFNLSGIVRNGLIPTLAFFRPVAGKVKISQGKSRVYANSLLKDYEGEWEFDTLMKFPVSPSVSINWLSAIKRGHRRVKKGLNIACPVLVLSSDASNGAAATSDRVLNYKHIMKRADRLGNNISKNTIHNGKHDLALSIKPARDEFYRQMFDFIAAH